VPPLGIALNDSSRLGWRILLATDPIAEGNDAIQPALSDGRELVDLVPPEYADRHRETARLVGLVINGTQLLPDEGAQLVEVAARSMDELKALSRTRKRCHVVSDGFFGPGGSARERIPDLDQTPPRARPGEPELRLCTLSLAQRRDTAHGGSGTFRGLIPENAVESAEWPDETTQPKARKPPG
jgi:hypothetical protein